MNKTQARNRADFSRETLGKISPKNEDGERCWLSFADKAKLGLNWVTGKTC